MENNANQNFVFGSDDDTYIDTQQSQRIDKLSLKVTLMAILLPSILIVVFIFMYLDMRNKVVQVHHTGSNEVQQTADELKQIIDDLKKNQVQLEKQLNDKIVSLEKALTPITKRVTQHKKDIAYLSNIKTDKKTQSNDVKTLTKTANSLREDVDSLGAQNGKLVTIAQQLQTRIEELPPLKTDLESQKTTLTHINASLENVKTDVSGLKTTIESLSKTSVSNDALAGELKKQKAFYRLELNELGTKMDKKIAAVKKRIPSSAPSGKGGSSSKEARKNK